MAQTTRTRGSRLRAVALVLAGVLAGTLLIQPVGAHFTQNTKHLGLHAWKQVVKDRVYTRQQANNRYYTKAQANDRYYTKAQIDGGAPGCQGVAPDDVMVKVGSICVDAYEASIWDAPVGGTQITGPLPCDANGQDCKDMIFARSVGGVAPRRSITWFQAVAALANSGKRLPSNAEWQMAAQGTPDPGSNSLPPGCQTSGQLAHTGTRSDCQSAWGAFDMVGNVSEWVADWDETAAGCEIWFSIFGFGDDLVCMGRGEGDESNHFPGALVRGGSVSSGSGAGVFAVDGSLAPSGSTPLLGFRGAR